MLDWRERDREVIEALTGLAEKKPGLGFWKLYDRLRRAGHPWNHKRVYRIYRELRLHQRSRRKKQTLICVALLIIDDFGLKPLKPGQDEDFHDLIAERYERAATLITSNLDFSEWGQAFPQQTARRLNP